MFSGLNLFPIAVLSVHATAVVMSLFFAVLAFSHNTRSITNRALGIMMAVTAAWVVSNFFIYILPQSIPVIMFVIGIQMALAAMQTFSALFFVYVFPDDYVDFRKIKGISWKSILFFGAALLAISISWILFTVKPGEFFPNTHIPITNGGPITGLWGFIMSVAIITQVVIAIKKYRGAKPENKGAFASMLYGLTTSYVLMMTCLFFLLQIFRTITINFYAPVLLMPMILGTGYAIVKHHLFSIKAVATELLILTLWLFLTVRIFFESTLQSSIIDVIVLIGSLVIGIFLIRSVLNEVKQKEKLAELNTKLDKTNADLNDLNNNLEQKVAEQTVEIRRAYEVEKTARIELEELDKAKDQFILATQHHLRTPLTIVKGYLQSIMTQKTTALDFTTQTYVTKAQESTERISSLVNELLDISQMEVGKSILSKTQVKIKDLVDNVLKELESEIQKRNLSVKVDTEDGTALNLDEHKIREALVNVIDNAIKYNKPNGSLTITGSRMPHPIEKDKQMYKIIISDTGIGLTSEELSKLFVQYFQRGKEAEKLYTTGRGIGMAVTENIIQAHGGRIYAESEGRGKGSRFIVELPID